MNIHDATSEKIELAKFYAEDGAFLSAARILREAADMFQAHSEAVNAALKSLADDPVDHHATKGMRRKRIEY